MTDTNSDWDAGIHGGRLVTDGYAPDLALACPRCGYNYTHVTKVTLQTRFDGEDSESQLVALDASGRMTKPDEHIERSSRRSAVAISGTCEAGHEFTISFAQHKGITEVFARHRDDPNAFG